jgi:hypothetical protein
MNNESIGLVCELLLSTCAYWRRRLIKVAIMCMDSYSDQDKQYNEQPYRPKGDVSGHQLAVDAANATPHHNESVDCYDLYRWWLD